MTLPTFRIMMSQEHKIEKMVKEILIPRNHSTLVCQTCPSTMVILMNNQL